jgi:hypothetical protein
VLGLLCVLVGVASLLNRWLAPVPVALYLGWACIGCGVVASLLSLRSR